MLLFLNRVVGGWPRYHLCIPHICPISRRDNVNEVSSHFISGDYMSRTRFDRPEGP